MNIDEMKEMVKRDFDKFPSIPYVDRYLDGTFCQDFENITLIQNKNKPQKKIQGSGHITLVDSKLQLFLKSPDYDMFDVLGERHSVEAHKLIPDELTYKLIAKTSTTTWKAERVILFTSSFSLKINTPQEYYNTEAEIESLSISKIIDSDDELFKCQLVIFGNYNIQTSQSVLMPNNDLTFAQHKIAYEGTTLTISNNNKDGYLVLEVEGKKEDYDELLPYRVLEAIEIAIGTKLPVTIERIIIGNNETATLRSNISPKTYKIAPPLKITYPTESSNFTNFIQSYLERFRNPRESLYLNWAKVIDTTHNNIDTACLTITTVIEGVAEEYFKSFGVPDSKEVEDIKETIQHLTTNDDFDETMRTRITNIINSWTGFNGRKALINLQKEGVFSKETYKSWCKLRNSLAHGNIKVKSSTSKLQKSITMKMDVIGLFYSLVVKIIGYEGEYIEYSQKK